MYQRVAPIEIYVVKQTNLFAVNNHINVSWTRTICIHILHPTLPPPPPQPPSQIDLSGLCGPVTWTPTIERKKWMIDTLTLGTSHKRIRPHPRSLNTQIRDSRPPLIRQKLKTKYKKYKNKGKEENVRGSYKESFTCTLYRMRAGTRRHTRYVFTTSKPLTPHLICGVLNW